MMQDNGSPPQDNQRNFSWILVGHWRYPLPLAFIDRMSKTQSQVITNVAEIDGKKCEVSEGDKQEGIP